MTHYLFFCNTTDLLVVDYLHLMHHFAEQGHPVTACVPEAPNLRQRQAMGDGIVFLPMAIDRRRNGLINMLATLKHAVATARNHPDGIFTLITAQAHLLYGIPARLMGRCTVFLMAGMGTLFSSSLRRYRLIRPLVALLYRFLYRGPNSRVIVQNRDDQRLVTETLGASSAAFMPGCDTDRATFPLFPPNRAAGPPIVLVPARLIVEKGIHEAVAASANLIERGIAHQMWFSSDIDPGNPMSLTRADLTRLRRDHPSIRFLGFQDDIADVFRRADIVCLPSYREGLPTALVEACACGRPVVATDVQGCREIITHEVTGLLVPTRDPNALAGALERLISDVSLRDRFRHEAHRTFLERFTREAGLAAVMPVYESLEPPSRS